MKVTNSPLIAGLSGRAADAVAATWKGRQYVRKFVVPKNPNSALQVEVRDAFRIAVTLWRSLPTIAKDQLDVRAAVMQISGFNEFVRKNRKPLRDDTALTPVSDNPYYAALADLAGSVAVADTLTLTWTDPVLQDTSTTPPTDFDKVLVLLRKTADTVFSHISFDTLAATETLSITPLLTADEYVGYAALYNSTTGELTSFAQTAALTIT